MSKKALVLIIALALVSFSSNLWANIQEVDGSITYKANFINPDDGDSFLSNDIESYFSTGKLGLGLNVTSAPENDFLNVKPYATWKIGKGFDLVGGLLTDSNGGDYVHAGFWYATSVGKLGLFVDPRYYFGVSDEAESYLDLFASASYPLSERFSLGLEAVYDRWADSEDEWLLVGPVLSYKTSDSITVFTRISRETDFNGSEATCFRLGLTWNF